MDEKKGCSRGGERDSGRSRAAGERDRGFPLLVSSCREEDLGAGNRLDECVIPVENSGCHGQHFSLIRESGLQPHYSACLIIVCALAYQIDTLSAHTHMPTHTPSRCSPPVILVRVFWPTHKVVAREEGRGKKVEKKESLRGSVCLCLVCGLSSSVNRAAAVRMLACHYLIKNWCFCAEDSSCFVCERPATHVVQTQQPQNIHILKWRPTWASLRWERKPCMHTHTHMRFNSILPMRFDLKHTDFREDTDGDFSSFIFTSVSCPTVTLFV